MNRDKFIEYLDSPETLDMDNLNEIHDVLKEYPYFQTAHMLLVKTLNNLRDLRFNNQLKVSAAHIGNRHLLFNLIHDHRIYQAPLSDSKEVPQESLADKILGEIEELKKTGFIQIQQDGDNDGSGSSVSSLHSGVPLSDSPVDKESVTDVLLLDENADPASLDGPEPEYLSRDKETVFQKPDTELLELDKAGSARDPGADFPEADTAVIPEKKKPVSPVSRETEAHSFFEWLEMLQNIPAANDYGDNVRTEDDDRKPDLIDRFLMEKPRIEPRSPLDYHEAPVDMSAVGTRENEDFFTETLAKIYIQQKHYKKAIYAYEKLCLKFPEKYSYFADQIDSIKRLINP
jgi:hypothetical protein